LSGFHVLARVGDKRQLVIGAHLVQISQAASSTPFLCCSRSSPIAFNLSNTKSSLQLLLVPDCPFRRLKPTRSYPTRSPLHLSLQSTKSLSPQRFLRGTQPLPPGRYRGLGRVHPLHWFERGQLRNYHRGRGVEGMSKKFDFDLES
jgi:hypothetical protein